MLMRLRPTSIDSVTGMSSTTSRLSSRLAPGSGASGLRLPSSAGCASSALAAGVLMIDSSHTVQYCGLAARHALPDFHGLLSTRGTIAAADHRNSFGVERDVTVEVARNDVTGLQIHHSAEREGGAAEHRHQLYFG